jgi:hypothetical protein
LGERRGVIAHSHVIIITKTEFGRTVWEIEEEEREREDGRRSSGKEQIATRHDNFRFSAS